MLGGGIAQLARVLGSYPIGRWFESCCRYHLGPLVKRLRHRPFTAESWVQFPYGSPIIVLGNSVISPFPSFSFIPKIGFVRYLSAIRILQRTFLFYLVLSCGRKLNAPSIA